MAVQWLILRPATPHLPLIPSNGFVPEIQGKKRAPTGLPSRFQVSLHPMRRVVTMLAFSDPHAAQMELARRIRPEAGSIRKAREGTQFLSCGRSLCLEYFGALECRPETDGTAWCKKISPFLKFPHHFCQAKWPAHAQPIGPVGTCVIKLSSINFALPCSQSSTAIFRAR